MNSVTVREPEVGQWQRWLVWVSWLVSAAPVFIVLSSARWKLTENAWYVGEFGRIGWETPALPILAALQLAAIVLYVLPQTALLGAVLLTGYLGGAIASYVRIGEWYPPLVPFHDRRARLARTVAARAAPARARPLPAAALTCTPRTT